ncbi:MAG: type transport system permease protein [Chloroflexota bacterium]|jgi:ABC-2 type transport system permease protein|nr:type transport system permease protein [Chloroflexota bacterium]
MTIFLEVARVTLRALVGRRRTVLMLLLAGVPILVGLLVRANSDGIGQVGPTLDGLVVRIILPLVALVFGTAALGSELEDGSAVHLLTKPISRTTIVLAKVAVAGTLTAALTVPSTIITAILLAEPGADIVGIAVSLGVGVLVGSFLYASIFAALSILTSRGLLIGLGYALVWEGLLAGLLPGTQVFSVREYVRGIVHLVSPSVIDSVVGNGAVLFAAIALVAALAIASYRLATYEVRGGD